MAHPTLTLPDPLPFAVKPDVFGSENAKSLGTVEGGETGEDLELKHQRRSTAATAICLVWMGIAEFIMWRERQVRRKRQKEEEERADKRERRKKERAKKEEQDRGMLARLNPWR